jgi:hypothetical protein
LALDDIDRIIDACRRHIIETNSKDTEIETFLTRFLLIHLCAFYEKEIERIVVKRAEKSGDREIISYIEKTVDVRNIKAGSIKGNILKRFGDECANSFWDKVDNKELGQRYDNILENRNQAAHGGRVEMTLDELIKSHEFAKKVLATLSAALKV